MFSDSVFSLLDKIGLFIIISSVLIGSSGLFLFSCFFHISTAVSEKPTLKISIEKKKVVNINLFYCD